MECNICGNSQAPYSNILRQFICSDCAKDTSPKIGQAQFDVEYWGSNVMTVPTSIRKEFYSDYLASKHDMPAYIKATRQEAI